jgi:hypothetical protein
MPGICFLGGAQGNRERAGTTACPPRAAIDAALGGANLAGDPGIRLEVGLKATVSEFGLTVFRRLMR